jgi:chromosome partitioning protein
MIISLLNQKGGVGKTTLAVHLAVAFVHKKKRVLLVDADPQGSAMDWSANRESKTLLPVIGLPKAILHKELPKMQPDYDFIIIDGSPRVYDVARSALMASDLVLIPVQPSPYDVWAAKEIVDLLEEIKPFKENLKNAFVINRKIVNTAIGRDVNDALVEYNLPVLKSQISQRVSFAECAAKGLTVLETESDGLASKEIKLLVKEILEFLK